jgi:hypothetical protein
MKKTLLALAAALLLGSSAQAAPILIGGFDFSQYVSGFLSIDNGNSLTDTLTSNYSDLDNVAQPGLGKGSEYVTMYMNGLFGSIDTPLTGTGDPFRPLTPNVDQNVGMAAVAGVNMGSVAAISLLQNEPAPGPGQIAFNGLSLTARAFAPTSNILNLVFGTSSLVLGNDYSIAFGGLTASSTSNVGVEFSTDGATYSSIGSALLTTTAQAFSFSAPAIPAETEVFFRLVFTGSNTILPRFDNVTIKGDNVSLVPEPGTVFLTLAGLGGLGVFGRKRRC